MDVISTISGKSGFSLIYHYREPGFHKREGQVTDRLNHFSPDKPHSIHALPRELRHVSIRKEERVRIFCRRNLQVLKKERGVRDLGRPMRK